MAPRDTPARSGSDTVVLSGQRTIALLGGYPFGVL